jgi:hypothetical protein
MGTTGGAPALRAVAGDGGPLNPVGAALQMGSRLLDNRPWRTASSRRRRVWRILHGVAHQVQRPQHPPSRPEVEAVHTFQGPRPGWPVWDWSMMPGWRPGVGGGDDVAAGAAK